MRALPLIAATTIFAAGANLVSSPESVSLGEEAIGIVQQFAGTLKPELKTALQSGGPAAAIAVCSTKAPAIAKELSENTGWDVRRVSLKPRNPNAVPDEWERRELTQLALRQAAKDGTDSLVSTYRQDGLFRFIKAQPVEPICLKCHGTDIDPKVADTLKALYPRDLAIGYSLGEIRGAISLAKRLEDEQEQF